jgi:hypothetical protein
VTAQLAGVDFSTHAIHVAIIPLDPDHGDPETPAVIFRHEPLPSLAGNAVTRIREARRLMRRELLRPTRRYESADIDYIAHVTVEEAFGRFRNADRALLPLEGAIVGGVPDHMTADLLTPYAWRKELGLRIGAATSAEAKAEANTYVLDWLSDNTPASSVDGVPMKAFAMPDEHETDALCIALAARQILHREAAA